MICSEEWCSRPFLDRVKSCSCKQDDCHTQNCLRGFLVTSWSPCYVSVINLFRKTGSIYSFEPKEINMAA